MKAVWTAIRNWFASKGGFAHVAAGVFTVAVVEYKMNTQFAAAANAAWAWLPQWVHIVVILLFPLWAWYKSNQA